MKQTRKSHQKLALLPVSKARTIFSDNVLSCIYTCLPCHCFPKKTKKKQTKSKHFLLFKQSKEE